MLAGGALVDSSSIDSLTLEQQTAIDGLLAMDRAQMNGAMEMADQFFRSLSRVKS